MGGDLAVDPQGLRSGRAVVVGLGITGQAVAGALVDLGATVHALDSRPDVAAGAKIPAAVRVDADPDWEILSALALDDPPDLVVASPGIPPTNPLLARAAANRIPIWSEVELAWRVCPRSVAWLPLTGTNGKTTTVTMLASMLAAAELNAPAVGNVGTSVVETVMGAHGSGTRLDALAVELSSFQLHYTHSMAPVASACLNIAPDHLDWYTDYADYRADKARIFERTTTACIYNVQDADTMAMVSAADVAEGARAVGFTLGMPSVGQVGLVEDVLVDRAFTRSRQTSAQELATFADLAHLGSATPPHHQVANALAASALALAGGLQPAHIRTGLQSMQATEHRIQDAGTHGGVQYINDSKATNPHAALASLRSIPQGTGVWIAGGVTKGADLDPLVRDVVEHLRAVVVIGTDTTALTAALDRHAPDLPRFVVPASETEPMDLAVRRAADFAHPGDVVLLAPACASQDQFTSYGHRGQAFLDAVAGLGGTQ